MNDGLELENQDTKYEIVPVVPTQQSLWESTFYKAKELGVGATYKTADSKYETTYIDGYDVNSVLYGTPQKANFTFTEIGEEIRRIEIRNLYTPKLGRLGSTSITFRDGKSTPPIMTECTEFGTSPHIDLISRLFTYGAQPGEIFMFNSFGEVQLSHIERQLPLQDHEIQILTLDILDPECITYIEANGAQIDFSLIINPRLRIKRETIRGYTKHNMYKGLKSLTLG